MSNVTEAFFVDVSINEVPLTFAEYHIDTKYRYPRLRYQVSVYRTIGPLVCIISAASNLPVTRTDLQKFEVG